MDDDRRSDIKFLTTTGPQINILLLGILNLIQTILIVLTNAIVLYALIVKLKRFRKSSNVLLIFLGATDFLHGLVLTPIAAYFKLFWATNMLSLRFYQYIQCFGFILTLITAANILFITVEMFWNITKPMAESRSVKKYAMLNAVASFFFIILVVLFVYVLPRNMWILFQVTMIATGTSTCTFILFAHYKVNKEVRRMQEVQDGSTNMSSNIKVIRNTVKMSKSVLVAFGLCYIPYIVFLLCQSVIGYSPILLIYMEPWCEFFVYLNPALDPLIYCLRLKSVRNAVLRILGCKNKIHDGASGSVTIQ